MHIAAHKLVISGIIGDTVAPGIEDRFGTVTISFVKQHAVYFVTYNWLSGWQVEPEV
jgi:hypothetical protein